MVKLTDPRKRIKVSLPSFPEAEVEMYTTLLVGDQLDVRAQAKTGGDEIQQQTELMIYGLSKAIISWNFTEDDDTTMLPITVENLKRFPEPDLQALIEALADTVVEDGRKKKGDAHTRKSVGSAS